MRASAVDGEFDAGDVGGVIGGQERHRGGDFFRSAEPLGRDLPKQGFAEFPRIGFRKAELSEQRRLSVRVRLRSAAFEADTAEVPAMPVSSNQDVVKTMAPPSRISGSAFWTVK